MSINRSTMLDKSIFTSANIRIIGQANKELIFCLLLKSKSAAVPGTSNSDGTMTTTQPLILALDQHAVHERIRLEMFRKATFNERTGAIVTRKITPPMEFKITSEQWEQISKQLPEFEKIVGLKCSLKENAQESTCSGSIKNSQSSQRCTLMVSQIPSCFRCYTEPELFTDFLTDSLQFFSNPKNLLPADGTIPRPKLAPFLMEQLKTQACRGAIRFGEHLTYKAVMQMITALTNCQQCFRCAHGRILVKPTNYLPTEEEINIGRGEEGQSQIKPEMHTEFKNIFGDNFEMKSIPKYDHKPNKKAKTD